MDKSEQLKRKKLRLNEKLSKEFFEIYDKAVASSYVHKPVAYSLYKLWRKWDAKEKVRENKRKL